MKKILSGIFLALILILTSFPVYAANIQIKMDGVVIASDVNPEIRINRTMVPLRVISENLGAKVNWSDSEVTLTKNDMQVILKINSHSVVKNGKTVLLDVKPYIKNNRTFVPMRFLAETFGCNVNYKNSTVTVDTQPLVIDNVKIKALQEEYHMTMGGVVQQIKGNAYNKAIYNIFIENKGSKVEAPANYSWRYNIDTPGAYYKNAQYDFLDLEGNSIKRFDIYTLIKSFPAETLAGYPEVLIYDATENQWYLFTDTAFQSINQLIDTAYKNGFLKIISNTVA
ncbi:copper amine oxidase N-terminal domain-containing protein [Peribacillus loiseleuriae]|uniref:Copper amine oxidase n=1 Tax=Peribacillus loiseleuriae TaxID=1679170 RepID=A0A0K9GPU0_9BACI|nr:copper amine oxidase N-terminal domain-containing protein [Peribacillus loiseleuriae]KMY48675.1 copper amine oxidase [Peribacillus loiseleuriae]